MHDSPEEELPLHANEDFPRLEVTNLVAEAQARDAKLALGHVALIGTGLFLLALGLPCGQYFGGVSWLWPLEDGGLRTLPRWIVETLHGYKGWHIETSSLFVSALFFGLSFGALWELLRGLHFAVKLSSATALIAVLSPVVWLGATSPLPFASGLLGATVLAHSLFRLRPEHPIRYVIQVFVGFALATALAVENYWLLVPCLAAIYPSTKNGIKAGAFILFGALAATWVGVNLTQHQEGWRGLALLPEGLGSFRLSSHLLAWTLAWGGLWWGGFQLCCGRREPEETGPPKWALIWIGCGIVPMFAGGLRFGPTAAFLAPVFAVGFADAWVRKGKPERLVMSVLLQALLALVASYALAKFGEPVIGGLTPPVPPLQGNGPNSAP